MDEVKKPPTALDRLDAVLGKGIDIAGKVWDANAPVVAHGSAEAAAALYTGSGYVMYGEGATPEKGPEQQATAARGQSPYGLEPEHDHGIDR